MLYCKDNNDCENGWICCRSCEKHLDCTYVCDSAKCEECIERTEKSPDVN